MPKPSNVLERAYEDGSFRRFYWRPRQRIGPHYAQLSGRELRRWLRSVSWRRAF